MYTFHFTVLSIASMSASETTTLVLYKINVLEADCVRLRLVNCVVEEPM